MSLWLGLKKGNNYNKCQGQKEEQRRKAREQFKQAREKEKQKKDQDQKEQGNTKPAQSTGDRDTRTAREILGLSLHFTQEELKKAYKIKASRFHSDKYAHMSQSFRSEAEQEFKKIQRAYIIDNISLEQNQDMTAINRKIVSSIARASIVASRILIATSSKIRDFSL